MDPHFILIYTVTVFLASITPGPSMLLALDHGIRYGTRRTIITALGNGAATLIQALLSIAGLGAVLLQSQTLFGVIKWLGAAYLIFVGIKMLWNPDAGLTTDTVSRTATMKGSSGRFTEAFVVTMANPKAILFFTALFPQVISTQKTAFLQIFVIISLLLSIAFVCMMIYGYFGRRITRLLTQVRARRLFNRAIGGSFITMGIGVAAGRMK